MPKILLIGGSRDGEWVEDPGLHYYHSIIVNREPMCITTYPPKYEREETEVYHRIPFYFREDQEFYVYTLNGIRGYEVFDLLLKHYKPKYYNPKPLAIDSEDLEVTKRKAEDKLAAAAWNAFMSQPIPKQK